MDPISIGALLGGVGQAAGGIAGLFGGGGNNNNFNNSLAVMREQAQLQREFAQNGIRWKVEDAKAAGIHPLYAIGGSGASYSPSAVSVGTDTSSSLGRDLSDMGQGLGRAVAASASKEDRAGAAYNSQMRIMGLERASLENRLLETQIAASQSALMRSQIGPGMPTGASVSNGNSASGLGVYAPTPPEVPNSRPGNASLEAGPPNPGSRDVMYMDHNGLRVAGKLPGKDLNFEELSTPGTASWQFMNSVLPFVSQAQRDAIRPDNRLLPAGATHWRWTPFGFVAQYPRVSGRTIANSALHHRRVNNSPNYGPRASTHRYAPSGAER